MPPLTAAEIARFNQQVHPDWQVIENHHIQREFRFANFREAMGFVNMVAAIAESEGHHPDILVYQWNRVRITLWTHAINGLSENDFIVAAKIDQLVSGG